VATLVAASVGKAHNAAVRGINPTPILLALKLNLHNNLSLFAEVYMQDHSNVELKGAGGRYEAGAVQPKFVRPSEI
jgi:hypothetical protein